jgi:hypothetical protein
LRCSTKVFRYQSKNELPSSFFPKNGGKWRFLEGQKRHFSVFGAWASKHSPLISLLLCRPTFLAPESTKNVGRHFSSEDFVDVARRGRLRLDAILASRSQPSQSSTSLRVTRLPVPGTLGPPIVFRPAKGRSLAEPNWAGKGTSIKLFRQSRSYRIGNRAQRLHKGG